MNIHRLEILIRRLLDEPDGAIAPEELDEEDRPDDSEDEKEGIKTREPSDGGKRWILILCIATALVSSFYLVIHHLRASGGIAWEAGSTALCKDNTFSPSHHRSGTCSWHGGVALWRYPSTDTIWK